MDVVESVSVYSGDSGDWSDSAMRDVVWYLRKFGRKRPKYIRRGGLVRAKLAEVLIEKDLDSPIGRRLFAMSCLPETESLFERFKDHDGRAYTYMPSLAHCDRRLVNRVIALAQRLCYPKHAPGSSRAGVADWRLQCR